MLGLRLLEKEGEEGQSPTLTLIGTPMLKGLGVITMIMILVQEIDPFLTACVAVGPWS